MSPQDFRVVCLQRYPEYYEETITLLNNQWPRSRTARMRSLEQGSRDGLPTSLILLERKENGREIVVAHSKISPVPYQPLLCFVESVVVMPDQRGKGLGRLIMENTEVYVKSLGITTVYLTTFDQQGFYSKLGYELCDPIVVFGGSMKLAEKTDNFKVFNFVREEKTISENAKVGESNSIKEELKVPIGTIAPPAPPPPPPPPPLCLDNLNSCNNNIIAPSKVTMRKVLQLS